jgi:hypothetical protein
MGHMCLMSGSNSPGTHSIQSGWRSRPPVYMAQCDCTDWLLLLPQEEEKEEEGECEEKKEKCYLKLIEVGDNCTAAVPTAVLQQYCTAAAPACSCATVVICSMVPVCLLPQCAHCGKLMLDHDCGLGPPNLGQRLAHQPG